MACYVDNVAIRYRSMIMCHLWADTMPELMAMVDTIGVDRRHLQQTHWTHFDISLGKKQLAIRCGAKITDKFGPVEYVAKLRGDIAMIERVAYCRSLRQR